MGTTKGGTTEVASEGAIEEGTVGSGHLEEGVGDITQTGMMNSRNVEGITHRDGKDQNHHTEARDQVDRGYKLTIDIFLRDRSKISTECLQHCIED